MIESEYIYIEFKEYIIIVSQKKTAVECIFDSHLYC